MTIKRAEVSSASMGDATELLITSAAELAALVEKNPASGAGQGKIVLEIDGFSRGEAQMAGERITRYRRACGCEISAAMLLLAVFGWVTYCGVRGVAGFADLLFLMFAGIALALVAGAVGKILGLLIARLRLRWEVARLLDVLYEEYMRGVNP